MAWNPNYAKGADWPTWEFCSPCPSISYHGGANAYDGKRYLYWLLQTGTTATSASTTQLWQYDTWSDGWAYLGNATNGNQGMDLEYDANRNVLIMIHGASLTSWQVYNLNHTAVVFANITCNPRVFTTITTVLPTAAGLGASISMPDATQLAGTSLAVDSAEPVAAASPIGAGSTATSLVNGAGIFYDAFHSGMIGMYARFTTGALAGQRRIITAVPAGGTTLTTAAFGAAPALGDQFTVELPEMAASAGGTTTTVVVTGAGWVANTYRDMDVLFLTGANAGLRRRIASHDATTLTLNAAVTGNPRTGALTAAPAAGDMFRIIPSGDFLYYFQGTGTYRIDVVQTTGAAWSASLATIPGALGGGSNSIYPGKLDPTGFILFRGGGNNNIYHYDMGLRTYTTITSYFPADTFTTGASVAGMHGRRRTFFHKEGTTRTYMMNIGTGVFEPGPTIPYSNPQGYDGKRAKQVITPDGVEYLYLLRAGSYEMYRVPLEWMV